MASSAEVRMVRMVERPMVPEERGRSHRFPSVILFLGDSGPTCHDRNVFRALVPDNTGPHNLYKAKCANAGRLRAFGTPVCGRKEAAVQCDFQQTKGFGSS